jgi:hypothetical protein
MDPKTGQTYNSPLNSYNPARGRLRQSPEAE